MRDIKIKIDAFRLELEGRDLIAESLAISSQKRELFTPLASRFRQMVADLKAALGEPPKKAG